MSLIDDLSAKHTEDSEQGDGCVDELLPNGTAAQDKQLHDRPPAHTLTRLRLWKNHIVLCLTFVLCFTSFAAIQNIQSSLNDSGGLGLYSLGTINAAMIISSLIAPAVIKLFTVKWTVVFTLLSYCFYAYANIFSGAVFLIPASFLLGFSAGPLWAAQGTHLTTSAFHMASLVEEDPEFVINRFNGVFLAFFSSTQVWGNMLSYVMLDIGSEGEKPQNISKCGSRSCGALIGSDAPAPNASDVDMMFALFSGVSMVAVLLSLMFLDPLRPLTNRDPKSSTASASLMATIKLIGNPKLILLIPLFVFNGVAHSFMCGTFSKSFVSCTQGVSVVGLILTAYGVTDAISSLIVGQLVKVIRRPWLVTIGATIYLGLMALMWAWDPVHITTQYLYIIAAGWGIADSIFQTQLLSFTGAVFANSQEPAFSNLRLWEALGMFFGYMTTIPDRVCVWHKLIGISCLLGIVVVCYHACEYQVKKEKQMMVMKDESRKCEFYEITRVPPVT